jgi:hypothetical protein
MVRTLTLALMLGASGATMVALAHQPVDSVQSAVSVSFETGAEHDFTASERAVITHRLLTAAHQIDARRIFPRCLTASP